MTSSPVRVPCAPHALWQDSCGRTVASSKETEWLWSTLQVLCYSYLQAAPHTVYYVTPALLFHCQIFRVPLAMVLFALD